MAFQTPQFGMTPGLGKTPAQNYSSQPYQTGNPLFDKMPMPAYQPGYDPSRSAAGQYGDMLNKNSQGYNAFMDQALSTGPSPWLGMATTKNNLETQHSKESAQRQGNSETAGAMSRLASSGGLTSGARERAIEAGGKNTLGMTQDIAHQGTLNNLALGMEDQQNHLSMLGQVPGMEQARNNGWLSAYNNDTQNQIGEAGSLNKFNQDLYTQRMLAAAAENQANATKQAGAESDASGLKLPGIDGNFSFGMGGIKYPGQLNPILNPVGTAINWAGDRLGIHF